jgi:hypothetical protein
LKIRRGRKLNTGKLADKLSGALEIEKKSLLKDMARLKLRLRKIKTFQKTLAEMNHSFPTKLPRRRKRRKAAVKVAAAKKE